jgi:hypothetical protein
MKNTENSRTMIIEEILSDTSLTPLHGFVRKIQNNAPASQLIPKKHELVLTDLVRMETKTLFSKNPLTPLKKVIALVFEDLTDDIPAPLMLKLTKIILNLWTELSEKAGKENPSAFAA